MSHGFVKNKRITDATRPHLEDEIQATVQVTTRIKYTVQNTKFPQSSDAPVASRCQLITQPL